MRLAIKIKAPNDVNGDPRRGWIVVEQNGVAVAFVDEGYTGIDALRRAYPAAVEGPTVEVGASEYRDWKRQTF